MSLAQLLSTQKANFYKVKAYRRAAKKIRLLSESLDELVHRSADLTQYSGIGNAISSAIREIVLSGTIRQLETLKSNAAPEIASLAGHPHLDPLRVRRIYKKFNISTIAELKEKLESGAIREAFGQRMDQHVRQAFADHHAMLRYEAEYVARAVEEFLLQTPGVRRAQPTGDFRRKVEVIEELSFLVDTADFAGLVKKMERYGGKAERLEEDENRALFRLPSGIILKIERGDSENWGRELVAATGARSHLRKLQAGLATMSGAYSSEQAVYRDLGLAYIEPELREGQDEIERARSGELPVLVSVDDVRGELHAHSTSSDGSNTIEQMAAGAGERGYEYIGISDHSQSLKIARGLTEEELWKQIRHIDRLNERGGGIRILKSAEVDILADGLLDYPDELLKELDYTVCSIHSRFGLNKAAQTERILRAMDNRYFTILGHATGRLLLKRPGYEIDIERVIAQAKANGCFFEINSSPDRLDLSAENARLARMAGVKIAVTTDAHSIRELDYIQGGIDQARRAGLDKESVLNCLPWIEFCRLARR